MENKKLASIVSIVFVVIVGFGIAFYYQNVFGPENNGGEQNATSTNATSTNTNATSSDQGNGQSKIYSWPQETKAPKISLGHTKSLKDIDMALVIGKSSLIVPDSSMAIANAAYIDADNDGQDEFAFIINTGGTGGSFETLIYKFFASPEGDKNYIDNIVIDRSFTKKLGQGFMGHLGFNVVENHLIESFPIYKASDPNCCPTGRVRYILYQWDSQNKKLAVLSSVDLEQKWLDDIKSGEKTFDQALQEAINRMQRSAL